MFTTKYFIGYIFIHCLFFKKVSCILNTEIQRRVFMRGGALGQCQCVIDVVFILGNLFIKSHGNFMKY